MIVLGIGLIVMLSIVIICRAVKSAATWMDNSFRWGGRDDW